MTPDQRQQLNDLLADAMPAPGLSGAVVEAIGEAASIAELARMAAEIAVAAAANGRDAAFVNHRLEPVLDAVRDRSGALRDRLERQWRRSCRS